MQEKKKDIFDKIMSLPGFRFFEPFYIKHKEVLMYLFFGGLAFFLNLFLFIFIDKTLRISELINNVICWIICVTFQFFTNRTWVFNGIASGSTRFAKQIVSFFGSRIFTLVVEEAILGVFITWLGLNSMLIKLIAQVVVIILNYILSKLVVFRKEVAGDSSVSGKR